MPQKASQLESLFMWLACKSGWAWSPRRPLSGMLLYIDGSKHRWLSDDRYYVLYVNFIDRSERLGTLPRFRYRS